MRTVLAMVMLIVLMVGAMPVLAQDNSGFETVVYPLLFPDIENIDGKWYDSPKTLSLDNVTDHMVRINVTKDGFIETVIIAQLISSEFVVIRWTHCPVWYESENIDFITFTDLDGQIFDF